MSADYRIALLTQSLAASTEVYKENARIIGILDDKAQKTAGLAAGILAAGFAFLRADALKYFTDITGRTGIILLFTSIGLLLGSVAVGCATMWVQQLQRPPDALKIFDLCEVLLVDIEDKRDLYIRDQINSWNRAIVIQTRVSGRKGKGVLTGQILLLLAIICVGATLGISLADANNRPSADRNNSVIKIQE